MLSLTCGSPLLWEYVIDAVAYVKVGGRRYSVLRLFIAESEIEPLFVHVGFRRVAGIPKAHISVFQLAEFGSRLSRKIRLEKCKKYLYATVGVG